jgi:uncharacterized protein (UPF0335 family)
MVNTFNSESAKLLRQLISKVEKLEEEKEEVNEVIRDTFSHAKVAGFDVKVLRQVIKRRKMDESQRIEQDEILQIYEENINGKVRELIGEGDGE